MLRASIACSLLASATSFLLPSSPFPATTSSLPSSCTSFSSSTPLLPGRHVRSGAAKSAIPSLTPRARASSSLLAVRMQADGLCRVVVTGMGINSCLGNTLDDVTSSLKEAKSGIRFRQDFADNGLKSQVCGWPELTEEEIKERIPRQTLRFMGPHAKYAYLALQDAINDSGLKESEYQGNPDFASILGQGGASVQDMMETVEAVRSQAPRWANKVGPYRVTRSMGSSVSAILATAFKLQGPSFSISSACSTGAHCIGVGMEQVWAEGALMVGRLEEEVGDEIQLGKAKLAACGAGEADGWEFTAMFDCMGALSSKYNDSPKTASRAFDKTRDGFVIAGGGGVLILEEYEHAKARGAKIYAELTGYGANSDGYDMVAPSGFGGEECMKIALGMANKGPHGERKVDYINCHGTSTPVGDAMELEAIKRAFVKDPSRGYSPFVGSTKSISGHSLGAAGVHEAIYSILMMQNDFLAESAHIKDICDESEGLNILRKRYDGKVNRVMSNSFGFGGTNACLVFDRV
ncbi:hypothetical protein GUITHDRAFT_166677 [Guillardia theta CCMP2712]|uniref:Nodulation protein E n=1 Tax=Guillardia theta (strain CCMP2712) TaxID=905079 RepID=L1I9J4_GUITC|nr:hypothetical protein GUITHDRAFT_166677 [Guillardia theta CCMP2712]EKX32579.1 hypothetical protein GUITHDRAFT_166677 [Guillardia theta CCMP2712]|eukprot:XP_005819559.1 hypothetical protein GUITHDRAFT_166677 [Guillardia theta CCMP2712]